MSTTATGKSRMPGYAEPTRASRRAQVGRVLAPALAIAVYLALPDAELGADGRAVGAVGALMATLWVTEALPLPVTSLLPIVLFPVLDVTDVSGATAPYASDLIFLFMGGFMIALSMQRWGLHERIAITTLRLVGTRPVNLVGGFMLATGFLSMWVSNTATTVMMLPIGASVAGLVLTQLAKEREDVTAPSGPTPVAADSATSGGSRTSPFATGLMLAIAFSASIGSLATLIGTPPNLFMAEFLDETYGIEIAFGRWMLVGLPLALVFGVIAWVLLTRVVFRPEVRDVPGAKDLLEREAARLGAIGRGERTVLAVFVATALAWILREPLTGGENALSQSLLEVLPGLAGASDAGIAILAAVALFALPVDLRQGVFALDWDTARQIPWGVLLLFGGGLSLANGVQESGFDEWVGQQVGGLGILPVLGIVAGVALITLLLTELTSNTATAATFLPILAGVAIGLEIPVLVLVVPAALAASCAFMMPVATPPNAIVFGSGYVSITQMVRAGVWLNLIGVVLITLVAATLLGWVFGVSV